MTPWGGAGRGPPGMGILAVEVGREQAHLIALFAVEPVQSVLGGDQAVGMSGQRSAGVDGLG